MRTPALAHSIVPAVLTLCFVCSTALAQQKLPGAVAPNLDIPFEIKRVRAEECARMTFRNGTTVCIPAGALISAEGKRVKGEVVIKYREFNSPFEMFLAGIPMTFKGRQMVSTGMYELRAYQNEKPLKLRPGSLADVQYRSQSPAAQDVSFFQLRDGKWEKTSTAVRSSEREAPPIIEAPDAYGEPIVEEFDDDLVADSDWMAFSDGWDGEDFLVDMEPEEYEDPETKALFQAAGISEFGIYNYDYLAGDEENVPIAAEVENVKSEDFTVYAVFKDMNTLVRFHPGQLEDKFYLLENRPYRLFVMTDDKQVSVFPETELPYDELTDVRNTHVPFGMEPLGTVNASAARLKSYLLFN